MISVVVEEKYFAAKVIRCKDGSNSFTRDRINDDFCDCVDGTDEPGTSACPEGKFYCRNIGNMPQFLRSSHVNDRYCDCCDGSDEHDGSIICPNTCIMGGNHIYKTESRSTIGHVGSIHGTERNNKNGLEEFVQKLKGLKILIILQLSFILCFLAFRFFRRHVKARRRRYR